MPKAERCTMPGCVEPVLFRGRCKKCYARWKGSRTASRKYVDYDYRNKLSPEEKAFLDKFTDEYYYNRGLSDNVKPLHKGKELRRQVYNADHARRRCVELTLAGPLTHPKFPHTPSPEDALIEAMDLQKAAKAKKK